jgi:hypothetical protein
LGHARPQPGLRRDAQRLPKANSVTASRMLINSALAPYERGADDEVPDCADHCLTEPRDPRHAVVFVDPGGDIDIGDRTDGADFRKRMSRPQIATRSAADRDR